MTSLLSCSYFPSCSGCSAIGVEYAEQLADKLRAVREMFAASSLSTFDSNSIQSITPSPNQAGYRNRAKLVPAPGGMGKRSLPVSRDLTTGKRLHAHGTRCVRLGLYQAGSHEVVDIPGCPVQTEGINEAVEVIRTTIERLDLRLYDEVAHTGDLRFVTVRQGAGTGDILIGLVTRARDLPHADGIAAHLMDRCRGVVGVVQNINPHKGNVIFGPMSRLLAGRDYLEEIVCGVRILLGITSFFQVNTAVAQRAYESILRNATPRSPPVSDRNRALAGKPPVAPVSVPPVSVAADDLTLLDLYAGVGTIGLVAARHVGHVYGIEESPEAAELSQAAARIDGLTNAHFREGLVEECLGELLGDLHRQGVTDDHLVAVLNPPRKGIGTAVTDFLIEARPARIAYLSCEPRALLRDLERFETGGYHVAHVELFDMFPQTEQVETLAVLQR